MIPIQGFIEENARGAWVADLEFVEQPDGLIDLYGTQWVGTVVYSWQEGGRYHARIVGGAGGLLTRVRDQQYQGAVGVNMIAGQIAFLAGETVGEDLPVYRVNNYHRMTDTAGRALSTLCDTLGLDWRIGRDGKLNVYVLTAGEPLAQRDYVRVGSCTDGPQLSVQQSSVVQIGSVYEGRTVRAIRWVVSPKRLVADLSFDEASATGLDYHKTYTAKVVRQSGSAVDVIVAGRFSLQGVPLLSGIPVATLTMLPGDLVNVGFYGADPRSPYAICTAQGTGAKAVARVDDTVDCGTLLVGTIGAVSGPTATLMPAQYVPPGPTHDAEVIALTLQFGAFSPISVPLQGVITSGQVRVKL
jgi:hypothetical protein